VFRADGQDLRRLVQAGLTWLQQHQEAINVLNVFPVPDGDTGTNMVLTMRSAWEEVDNAPEREVGQVAQKVAHGALMGARGNSGVILSQIWRGLARKLDGKGVMDGADLAAAMEEGAQTAYRGVIRPVEGTILTVAREAAEEAALASEESNDFGHVLERMVHRARDAVARTPELLAVLAQAGVVDAGGQGLYVMLEGMLRCLRGEEVTLELELAEPAGLPVPASTPVEEGYGYDVQFTIRGDGLDAAAILQDIDAMGDSALVVGDQNTVRVHVHVPDPGMAISYGTRLGSLQDVTVEDMQAQYEDFVVGQGSPPAVSDRPGAEEIAPVAVVAGEGLARVFQSLGAAAIVEGGQTMNPSTQEILQAVESVPSSRVIILPNNKNIVMTAEQARDLSDKQVVVVPTRTIPQGVSAILALNYQADLETNAEAMTQAAQEVQTGEVTTATRDASIGQVSVRKEQIIGLHDGELVVAGETPGEVVQELLDCMNLLDVEIVTLYYGAESSPAEAEALLERLGKAHPGLEFELIEGGQPHYFYLISAE
jgi:hypothetical protein